MQGEELFEEVRRRLLTALQPTRIIVFGSRVRGTALPDSDLDLLVVEPGGGTLGERGVRVGAALGRLGVPVDLVVYTPAEFEEQRRYRSSIAAIAEREGRVLHG